MLLLLLLCWQQRCCASPAHIKETQNSRST
jgi:hypothetical protein